MKEVHTSWEDSVKVLFTKPYFQHHLKSSLSNLKYFECTHDLKNYCVGVYSSKLQWTVKATARDEDTHIPCNCSFPLGIGLFLRCYSRWAHGAFEWSGDHKLAHTSSHSLICWDWPSSMFCQIKRNPRKPHEVERKQWMSFDSSHSVSVSHDVLSSL